tara:strand:+ start:132 stop:266 length:135 start_codon:yes stop_codon:yes gene_type:complete
MKKESLQDQITKIQSQIVRKGIRQFKSSNIEKNTKTRELNKKVK